MYGVAAYDNPQCVPVYMIVCNKHIYCGNLSNHLMCTMQSLMNGFNVKNIPTFLAYYTNNEMHAIALDYQLNLDQHFIIPIMLGASQVISKLLRQV